MGGEGRTSADRRTCSFTFTNSGFKFSCKFKLEVLYVSSIELNVAYLQADICTIRHIAVLIVSTCKCLNFWILSLIAANTNCFLSLYIEGLFSTTTTKRRKTSWNLNLTLLYDCSASFVTTSWVDHIFQIQLNIYCSPNMPLLTGQSDCKGATYFQEREGCCASAACVIWQMQVFVFSNDHLLLNLKNCNCPILKGQLLFWNSELKWRTCHSKFTFYLA